MNTVLWVIQIVLAVSFLAAGAAKVTQPKEKLKERMGWVDDYSQPMIRFIGSMEILGALGLVLPGLTGVAAILTPIAAVGLVVIMIGAAITHLRRQETPNVAANAVLLIFAAVVAWGRFGPYAF